MMVPMIHLNGNSKKSLQDEIRTAHDKLTEGMDALREMTIHGRNYYPISPDAYTQARTEQDARMRRIQETLDELQALYIHIEEGRFGIQDGEPKGNSL